MQKGTIAIKNIVILGGYGNFGKRITEDLAQLDDIQIIVVGRNQEKATSLVAALTERSKAKLKASTLDIYSNSFHHDLKSLNPFLTIHTGGPFQGQDYRVPKACIAADSHYIDLADDRRYVCDIVSLNDQAKQKNLLIVSGASSVPGLSSSVIDHYSELFSQINEIDFAIAPGNKAERGEATVQGILSYTGHPFSILKNNKCVNRYGWMTPRRVFFNDTIGYRHLANIDIPDLELFPKRYPSVKTVEFQAGLELPFLHYGMVFMASLSKVKLIKDWSKYTKLIFNCSEFFKVFGTDHGGMFIELKGKDKIQQPQTLKWVLEAKNGIGPYIPTLSTIILAKKLIKSEISITGATPCLGLYSLSDFDEEASKLGITHKFEVING